MHHLFRDLPSHSLFALNDQVDNDPKKQQQHPQVRRSLPHLGGQDRILVHKYRPFRPNSLLQIHKRLPARHKLARLPIQNQQIPVLQGGGPECAQEGQDGVHEDDGYEVDGGQSQ